MLVVKNISPSWYGPFPDISVNVEIVFKILLSKKGILILNISLIWSFNSSLVKLWIFFSFPLLINFNEFDLDLCEFIDLCIL